MYVFVFIWLFHWMGLNSEAVKQTHSPNSGRSKWVWSPGWRISTCSRHSCKLCEFWAKSFVLNLPNFEISSSFRATASPQYTDKRMFSRSCLSLSQVQPHSLLRRSRLIKDFAFLLANEKSWIPRLITVVDISQCWDQWAWRPSTRGAK